MDLCSCILGSLNSETQPFHYQPVTPCLYTGMSWDRKAATGSARELSHTHCHTHTHTDPCITVSLPLFPAWCLSHLLHFSTSCSAPGARTLQFTFPASLPAGDTSGDQRQEGGKELLPPAPNGKQWPRVWWQRDWAMPGTRSVLWGPGLLGVDLLGRCKSNSIAFPTA